MLPDPSNQWFWQEYERALKDRFGSLSLKDLAELSMIMKKKEYNKRMITMIMRIIMMKKKIKKRLHKLKLKNQKRMKQMKC